MPSWLTACVNKASATSAFQCITASVTPVPSGDSNGKKCYQFKGTKKWGRTGAQSHKKGRREDGEHLGTEHQMEDEKGHQGMTGKGSGWKWFGHGN